MKLSQDLNYHKLRLKLVTPEYVDQFGVIHGILSDDEIQNLSDLESKIEFQSGDVGRPFNSKKSGYRVVQQAGLSYNNDLVWLYDKLEYKIAEANYDLFLYDTEHLEGPVYLIYNGSDDPDLQGKYDVHRDTFSCNWRYHRLITGIIMLSDRSEYTGGDLYVDVNGHSDFKQVDLQKGDMVLFNSFCSHYVSNVESGTRKALVFWVCGKGPL